MLGLFEGLTPELVAGAFVGFTMVGVIVRNALLGWYEANAKMKEGEKSMSPLINAMSISWDRNQIERALAALEGAAESLELIAKAQSIMSDQFQQTTQSKLNELLEKLARAENPRRRTP